MDLVGVHKVNSASSFANQEIPKLFFLEVGKHFRI